MRTREHERMQEARDEIGDWHRWGPYVSERAWSSVREDYSANGDAWNFLPHDLARSKAYRWGEDGIAGLCDRFQLLCFAPAFWNGRDPILKERLFGLTPFEGNHGEDVKEYYFHVDNTPTHSYMKYVYKYPQAEYPYQRLVDENRRRDGRGPEYELIDTGVFDDQRYFDIVIEYGKVSPEDIFIRMEAFNRGPASAPLHILPQLWFRNTWMWDGQPRQQPEIRVRDDQSAGALALVTDDTTVEMLLHVPVRDRLGRRVLHAAEGSTPLFTNNETNMPRVFGPGHVSATPYVKDAIHRAVVGGEACTNPQGIGTKAALHYRFDDVPAGGSVVVRLRLSDNFKLASPLIDCDKVLARRRDEADEFYASIQPQSASADERRVQRQALAGVLWSKSTYILDVSTWLDGDNPAWPTPASRKNGRNQHWRHLHSHQVQLPAEKWEYPWFAAWDLAFSAVALAIVDAHSAKEQLWMLLNEQFQHPNGQIPAYEWEFSDLNPPVHAWAVWRVYNMDRIRNGVADREFLSRCFHKLLINFAWWVNKVDRAGNNIFEGGFLGLDNITVFDRSSQNLDGSVLEQSDATGWMGMFCLNLMRISLELAKTEPEYESLATKFFAHYAYVASAMKHFGTRGDQLWDEEDGFFYDILRYPDGRFQKFRVRSLVGLIPLFAVERLEREWIRPFKSFTESVDWFLANRRDLVKDVVHTVEHEGETTHALTILDQNQLRRLMDRVWNEGEFLSPYGLRSMSKAHEREPFLFNGTAVRYEPAETQEKIKGGNSNWRGPIWFPTSFLLIESLRKLGKAFGPSFTLTPPAAGGAPVSFQDMSEQLADRLINIFRQNSAGERAVYGDTKLFQHDPHWRDYILFYEYFHGDNGAGLGASHQTGWTALVASLIDEWRGLWS